VLLKTEIADLGDIPEGTYEKVSFDIHYAARQTSVKLHLHGSHSVVRTTPIGRPDSEAHWWAHSGSIIWLLDVKTLKTNGLEISWLIKN